MSHARAERRRAARAAARGVPHSAPALGARAGLLGGAALSREWYDVVRSRFSEPVADLVGFTSELWTSMRFGLCQEHGPSDPDGLTLWWPDVDLVRTDEIRWSLLFRLSCGCPMPVMGSASPGVMPGLLELLSAVSWWIDDHYVPADADGDDDESWAVMFRRP